MSQGNKELIPKWYVVHTYSGYENKVKTDLEKTVKNRELEDYFFEIIVPMEEQIEIKDGKKKVNLKKVFPGYVLIKMIMNAPTTLKRFSQVRKPFNHARKEDVCSIKDEPALLSPSDTSSILFLLS